MSDENHYCFYDVKALNLKITDEFKKLKITDGGVKEKKNENEKEKETANILKEVEVKNGKDDGGCCKSCYII